MQSLVTPFGYQASDCGYCKDASTGRRTPESQATYYLSSKSLTVDVYQALVDRGFRRSGTLFYKPDVVRQCCPHYTIRLPVASFTPGRDQRQAVNRWNKYILGEEYLKEAAKLYPKSKEEKARQRNSFDLVTAVHESEYSHLKTPPEPAHRFEVTLEPDSFTPEKFELYKNYQQHVHHDQPSDITTSSFKRFLCESPLHRTSRVVDGQTRQYGSFHQCYRVDGRLVAIGVLDLLPHAVSGVYLMYHSDFEKWSIGKLSAMREAALALEQGYQYYYMGYYIHSCVKMRYKGTYKPQYMLDPETYEWNPLDDQVCQLLDRKPFVSLARERRRKEAQTGSAGDLEATTEDAYEEYPLRAPCDAAAAVNEGLSLFDLKVPGLMTAEETEDDGLLGSQVIKIRRHNLEVAAQDLVVFEKGDIRDPTSIKGHVGEFVACVGPEVSRQVVFQIA